MGWFGPSTGDCSCCGGGSDCTVGNCQCLVANDGALKSVVRLDVVLSGSAQTIYKSCVSTGTTTGFDWTGTYSINCGTPSTNYEPSDTWSGEKFVGTSGGQDFYVKEQLFIRWRAGYDSSGVQNQDYWAEIA